MKTTAMGRLLGYNQGDSNTSIVSQSLIRIALVGYLVFNAWQGYNWDLFGYNIFLLVGIVGLILIIVEVVQEEMEK